MVYGGLGLYGGVLNTELSGCHLALNLPGSKWGARMMIAALSPWVCGAVWVHPSANLGTSWVDRNRQFVSSIPSHARRSPRRYTFASDALYARAQRAVPAMCAPR